MSSAVPSTSAIARVHALRRAKRMFEAEQICREACEREPDNAHALHLLGMLYCESGRETDALELIQRATNLLRENAQFHHNLGTVLGRLGRDEEAGRAFSRALELYPNYSEALGNFGAAMQRLGHYAKAEAAGLRLIGLDPKSPAGYTSLGRALASQSRYGHAILAFRQAIQLEPMTLSAWNGLLAALEQTEPLDEVLEGYRRAILLFPENAALQSSRLYLLICREDITAQQVFEEHREWARKFADPLILRAATPPSGRSLERRLRIGYVSPDFNDHPTPKFLLPIWSRHDRERVEVFFYAHLKKADNVTREIRGHADHWRDITHETDEATAEVIREDEIDILVDLAGHMANPRLKLFALRPAPALVSYLAYPVSTAISAVDYRITDSTVDPPGYADELYTEKLIRLDRRCCWCFDAGPCPSVGPLPAKRNGFVTFGVFNRIAKIQPSMIRLWAKILASLPNARLLVLTAFVDKKDTVLEQWLVREGIPTDRLDLISRRSRQEYLALYNRIDLALDTFPYNGMTTTCDALAMGVPTVTLSGDAAVSRSGMNLLNAVGLPNYVARTNDAYVAIASGAGKDLVALETVRSTLRSRMRQSELMDYVGLTREVEAALHYVWRSSCAGPIGTINHPTGA